ncbi:PD-(D/E)XK nuclease family protein [Bifidobacterium margollesii]|nr:PD-(D/E)XK nuclease family protein [Bifidobacterium margollesii]
MSSADAMRLVRRLFDGELINDEGAPTRTLLVVGAPRSGKTGFATDALYLAMEDFGDERSVMVVSDRLRADALNRRVIARLGVTSQARPVTTLSALAFRMIAKDHARRSLPMPKLLNGAEQDALLRSVLAVHVGHMQAGDQCDTCRLLMRYFAEPEWASLVTSSSALDAVAGAGAENGAGGSNTAGTTSDAVLARGINAQFVSQLRDMLARMNELGVSQNREESIIAALAQSGDGGEAGVRGERLAAQWRLAFALRAEYIETIGNIYPDEFRLDSSRLLVEGSRAVELLGEDELPQAVIVDDAQDMTLAGMSFIQRLTSHGCALVLVGNPDEAVQSFRGSYPEFLFLRVPLTPFGIPSCADGLPESGAANDRNLGRLAGVAVSLEDGSSSEACVRRNTYLGLLSSRVSLSIASREDDPVPLPKRPGKLPRIPGSSPIASLPADDPRLEDGSVHSALYRSPSEEMDDVVWRIKHAHIVEGEHWNELALIAHDNATVRMFGERLRREGVPVRYSSVTRPLKDEPFIRGLFALIDLSLMMRDGIGSWRGGSSDVDLRAVAAKVRSCAMTVMRSPLFTVGGGDDRDGRPVRMSSVNAALKAMESLSQVIAGKAGDRLTDTAALGELVVAWNDMLRQLREDRDGGNEADTVIDDSLFDGSKTFPSVVGGGPGSDEPGFGLDAMYLLLSLGGDQSRRVLESIHAVCGSHGSWHDPDVEAFERMWSIVRRIADGLRSLPGTEPQYVLWMAWSACAVSDRWQRMALIDGEEGREANDRLDAAMRLFQFAEGTGGGRDIRDFMERVKALEIEADSLAHIGPIEDAVSLTTPAGAAGRSWKRIWLPSMQQGTWPNLAARNTMFGAESLADVMLRGRLSEDMQGGMPNDIRRSSSVMPVLYAEEKGLLVALTRASQTVYVSAVMDDDHTPSDFLYGFLPERFSYETDGSTQYAEVGQAGDYSGLELSVRGLVTAARSTLAIGSLQRTVDIGLAKTGDTAEASSRRAAESQDGVIRESSMRDAADALAYLAEHGHDEADPANWPFLYDADPSGSVNSDAAEASNDVVNPDPVRSTTVTLSPSAVDGIWACPVCWMMGNRFAGPRSSSVVSGFGTIIHEVARKASELGLDLPDYRGDQPPEIRVELITRRMMEIYRDLRIDPADIPGVPDRYAATRKDESAETMLRNIADYFVHSNEPDYAKFPSAQVPVGTLVEAQCELKFLARFGLRDILRDYNAINGRTPVEADDLYELMGLLVGGWPEGMSPDLSIRLTGRIDRRELRRTADGTAIRLIDYKTGRERSGPRNFSDLQLACYQLGLRYHTVDEHDHSRSSSERDLNGAMPRIAQSGLFFVASRADPSHYFAPESSYQPALFDHGHITAEAFHPRSRVKELSKLFAEPDLPQERPDAIGEAAWARFLEESGTQTMWSLTMIARVLYAAGAMRSRTLTAHPDPEHVEFCRMTYCCPACAGESRSVMEENR